MTRKDVDRLLWEISRHSEERDDRPLDDAVLVAYRRGELSAGEVARVERRLAASAVARRRLAELAGVKVGAAPPPKPSAARPAPATRSGPPSRSGWRLAAVIAITVITGGLGLLWLGGDGGPPEELAGRFEVTVEAEAVARSTAATEWVRPETRVEIRIEPTELASAGLEFGLYRLRGDLLERIPAAPPVELTVHRGAASFVAPAAALVGDAPGEHRLFVVAGASGDLPARLRLAAGEEPVERLGAGGRRFVASRTLTVRPGLVTQ